MKVRYELPKNANELRVFISATTDKSTPVSIAQHSYFNLAGHNSGSSILDHVIKIHGDHYTPVDDALIPTGARQTRGRTSG